MSYVDTTSFLSGLFLVTLIFILIISVVVITCTVLYVVGLWKTFKKAGKKGWEAIIPFYNQWVLVKISGCVWWFFIIIIFSSLMTYKFTYNFNDNITLSINSFDSIFTLISLFTLYLVNYNISKKFNKDYLFAIGLTFLPFIFYPILGLGKSEYNKKIKVSPYGVFKEGDRK